MNTYVKIIDDLLKEVECNFDNENNNYRTLNTLIKDNLSVSSNLIYEELKKSINLRLIDSFIKRLELFSTNIDGPSCIETIKILKILNLKEIDIRNIKLNELVKINKDYSIKFVLIDNIYIYLYNNDNLIYSNSYINLNNIYNLITKNLFDLYILQSNCFTNLTYKYIKLYEFNLIGITEFIKLLKNKIIDFDFNIYINKDNLESIKSRSKNIKFYINVNDFDKLFNFKDEIVYELNI